VASDANSNEDQINRPNWIKRGALVVVLWLPPIFQMLQLNPPIDSENSPLRYESLGMVWQLSFAIAVVVTCITLTWRGSLWKHELGVDTPNWKLGGALWGSTLGLFILMAPILKSTLRVLGNFAVLPGGVYETVSPYLALFAPWGAFGVAISAVIWVLANIADPVLGYAVEQEDKRNRARERAAGAGTTVAGVVVVHEYEDNDSNDGGSGMDVF
jgi:hypothetical protein